MGDRYTYISLIGLFIVIAWGVPDILAGWRQQRIVLATGASHGDRRSAWSLPGGNCAIGKTALRCIPTPSRSPPTTPSPTITWEMRCEGRGNWRRPSRIMPRPCVSIPTTRRPTPIWQVPSSSRASSRRPSSTITRPSGLSPTLPGHATA